MGLDGIFDSERSSILAGQLQSRKPENPKIRPDVRPGVQPGAFGRTFGRAFGRTSGAVVGGARVVSGAEKKLIEAAPFGCLDQM